ncbi:NTP transferase domain-containing protein [Streptomyces sp. NPDC127084]|uniref:nucleotidyltransferase family protein n=1 Tax=Streptomyces sp. NPDC127084 TaxID=3347133 RepID=UPI003663C15A
MVHTSQKPQVAGLVLAAGGGRRLGGRPKALLEYRGRPLVENAVRVLRAGGCRSVHVVLGAAADQVLREADLPGCGVSVNADWEEGMGSSLRVGLAALAAAGGEPPDAVLVSLVDQPGIGAAAVARVVAAGGSPPALESALVSAAYEGRRGHPVLFGSSRLETVAASAAGDRGAREYLRAHEAEITLVECADVAEPYDIDTPEDLGHLE